MNEENTLKIINLCPTIYSQNFYFECGDGWTDIILELSLYAEKISKLLNITEYGDNETCLPVSVQQVKEKFGGLRFYIYGIPCEYDLFHKLVSHNEYLSFKICDGCGGDIDTKYNKYKNLCSRCS